MNKKKKNVENCRNPSDSALCMIILINWFSNSMWMQWGRWDTNVETFLLDGWLMMNVVKHLCLLDLLMLLLINWKISSDYCGQNKLIPGYTFTSGSNQNPCVFQSQERGDTDRAIERLSQRTNLSTRAQEKCGELLSMLLEKSWPKSTQGANTSGLDPVTVNFLLSWKSMAAYFRFFGICF